jgi:hypothetical protein
MRRLPLVFVLTLAVSLGGRLSIAVAQDLETQGSIERLANTSPDEKMQFAASANQEMRDAVKAVSKLMDNARRESNVDKIQCVSTLLTSIRSLVQVSEQAEVAMKEALSAGEVERADHEFRKVAVALNKTRSLQADAERCGDQGGLRSGETVISVDGGVADDSDDTTDVVVDVFDLGFDPPQASPFN